MTRLSVSAKSLNWKKPLNRHYQNSLTMKISETIKTLKDYIEVLNVGEEIKPERAKILMIGMLSIESKSEEMTNRITDLERTISNFITHVEEFNGSYQPEELKKLRDSIAIERPYYSPVSYHDNWTGKEVTNEK